MHHRESYRLKGYDYTREGLYYITICVYNREQSFGKIDNCNMIHGPVGQIADHFWSEMPFHFPYVILHAHIIMPNHVHGIIEISDTAVGTRHGVSQNGVSPNGISHQNEFGNPIHGSIPVIINQYKSAVKRWCNKNNHEDFQWQSRYYDHIIRSFEEFEFITDYIRDNPAKWINDPFQHK